MTRTSALLIVLYTISVAAAALAIGLLLLILFPDQAKAFDDFHWGNAPPEHRKTVRKRHKSTRVKAWHKDEWPIHDDRKREPITPPAPLCVYPVLVSGIQGLTERGAEEKARDAWAAKVRAIHGERLMDLRFAQGFKKRCYRSSVGDNLMKSMRDKIGERIGMVEDRADSNDAMEYRCELFATPCEPPWQDKGEDVKNAGATQ